MAKAKRDNELRLVRAFSAPVDLVWEAFTDEKHQAMWWGPRGFTITTKSKALKPGGKWIYTMHGPDGTDYPNITTYLEVEKNSRLVYDHGANEEHGPLFRVTITFEEVQGSTVMDMTMTVDSPEAAKEMEKHIKAAGGNSTWDRLGEYLEQKQSRKDVFIISRSFKADLRTTFDMWTDPKHLIHWLPPEGTSMDLLKGDIRAGGNLHFSMTDTQGEKFYGLFGYKEINPPRSIIYTQVFCDEKQNIGRPPFAPTWPETILNTVVFTEEGPDETRVTIQSEILGEATDSERETFNSAKEGMTGGWTISFDKFESLLRS